MCPRNMKKSMNQARLNCSNQNMKQGKIQK